MPAPKHIWLGRVLDALLLITTLAAVAFALWKEAPDWADPLVLACFFVFFVWRWLISMDRHAYLKDNWLDLALIVVLASPLLRVFTALRVMRILPALRLGAFLFVLQPFLFLFNFVALGMEWVSVLGHFLLFMVKKLISPEVVRRLNDECFCKWHLENRKLSVVKSPAAS